MKSPCQFHGPPPNSLLSPLPTSLLLILYMSYWFSVLLPELSHFLLNLVWHIQTIFLFRNLSRKWGLLKPGSASSTVPIGKAILSSVCALSGIPVLQCLLKS